ncbi:alpha-amylase family glycosyl hydrolase [uncultured Duncaniella sp.]|uniref:alpha-amylase family glycosyl hydrolase n=1 Tax=uncultured Duncaniella sp. TaxID=2768039 RepID=UPI0026758C9E|nr:alpha-amylase family glycosyl hydrolase [uncultured Duncaniella sp.]MCI9171637.1 alpha-amylase [Muribaculaceae bacterium]
MNKTLLLTLATGVALASCGPKAETPQADTNDDVILHAWSWSFDTIAANMHDIAEAGYAYVQTSPANTCFVGEDGGMALFSQPGDSVKGKWYYYYQPTDWKIGNYLLGDRDQFKAMMDSAAKYNVKVIVDVLPNHTAVDHTAVLPDLDNAVGGHDKLFHANGFNDIIDYNDRYQCTTGKMGGLPDVNTENPDFQAYYMTYVNDLLSLGVRGFRYDTAKHIGLPSDPLDSLAERNNFWDIATGREAVKGISLGVPRDSLFIYGEVLQDRNVKEAEYGEYMDLTASAYGHALRKVLDKGDFNADSLLNWHHPVDGKHLVTWVESHDTYANEHESAGLTDDQIRMGWIFLAARQNGTPLFFSRPAGSTRENYWGNNRVGARGNDEFKHPEVVAINKFRRAMHGQPETIIPANEGAVVAVQRGTAGLALINLSSSAQTLDIDLSATLPTFPDGTYTDPVSGATFTVASGHLTGTLAPYTSALLTR